MSEQKPNPLALLPILIFVILYLGLGIIFEYILKIPMGFYKVPIVIVFLLALLVAYIQNRSLNFEQKFICMGKGVGEKNIVTMILIFLCSGIFVGVVGRESASSVAYFMLSLVPYQYSVVILFLVASFVSLAMGTSVGTITLLTPISIVVSNASGFNSAFCIGSVVSGAMFGDNLSFISDTTIAACSGQGCQMRDKFKENFFIALPAAILSCIIILVISFQSEVLGTVNYEYNLIQIIPYILVLIGGIIGINVFYVLLIGSVAGAIIMMFLKSISFIDLITNISSSISGMYETIVVTILVSSICSLIIENGGFVALLEWIKKIFKGKKGGQFGISILVIAIDVATANNTVAIVMANSIVREISQLYKISHRRAASLLDTFSCVAQGIIPYGAQMLVALSIANQFDLKIDAFDIIPYLFYSFLLMISAIIAIFVKDKIEDNEKFIKIDK